MMNGGNEQQLTVPPGFRFHPTDEELLHYYLRKKVTYEPIDLDVIREVDLNRLEPWDLKEKCRIGTGPQNDWYLFSHKDRKYPTGSRTNRATTAGFWKATGRDKPIYHTNSKKIGMRKTLVFYIGRAPHGQKTDWIMHEYRLQDDNDSSQLQKEDGWVICRVFKKKNYIRGFQAQSSDQEDQEEYSNHGMSSTVGGFAGSDEPLMAKQHFQQQPIYGGYPFNNGSTNLPHLSSPDSAVPPPQLPPQASSFLSQVSLNTGDLECSQNLLRLTSGGPTLVQPATEQQRFSGDWTFLDKLLTNYQTPDHQNRGNHQVPPENSVDVDASTTHHHHHHNFLF